MTEAMTRSPRKVQLGLGLPPRTLARLDRLRACTGLTRGDVVDAALNAGGLVEIEEAHAELIERFAALAERAGQGWEDYAHDYARKWSSKTYPPTVSALEELEPPRAQVVTEAREPESASVAAPRVRKTLRDMT
jgi:hypothetical protein